MIIKVVVKPNSYFDSVALMAISKKIAELPGVTEAVVGMGTELNKELIANVGLETEAVVKAGANDLLIAVKAQDEDALEKALIAVEEALAQKKGAKKGAEQVAKSLEGAISLAPESNLAIISLPGAYAAREARKALENDLHVMLFSDNVPIEEEISLKQLAHAKGLLMMGPDCGTAMINHVPLCFANVVRPGNIGIVAASGTGTQEVTSLIDRFGGGVSQVIGTGGRDLKVEVGGIMMLDGIAALEKDPDTEVIVIISKPPAPQVAEKVLAALAQGAKPKVVFFLGGDRSAVEKAGAVAGYNLEDTARKAVALAQGKELPTDCVVFVENEAVLKTEQAALAPGQKYVRALYTGGTLCDEAMLVLQKDLGGIYSNIAFTPEFMLENTARSKAHTAIDLGDDKFTVGRPHPMIDPTIRIARLLQEGQDPETAVILMDVVLGYGSHTDPAGIIVPAVKEAKAAAKAQGRHLAVVASICGTHKDPQNFTEQEAKLREAGVIITSSNVKAAKFSAALIKDRQ